MHLPLYFGLNKVYLTDMKFPRKPMKELLLSQLVFCSLNQNHKLDSSRKNQ